MILLLKGDLHIPVKLTYNEFTWVVLMCMCTLEQKSCSERSYAVADLGGGGGSGGCNAPKSSEPYIQNTLLSGISRGGGGGGVLRVLEHHPKAQECN